ncbi:MAG: alpha/beta hydrolase [Lachnospiraceae bacterium]|nr:alpha/beta hydrolase [Lachnospiraceae bacterium]
MIFRYNLGKYLVILLLISLCGFSGCKSKQGGSPVENGGSNFSEDSAKAEEAYGYEVIPLEREGVSLHLDRMWVEGSKPSKNILLVHGVTFSSFEFDINYKDYSLVRRLAREGYSVWRLDIAGFGQSGEVEDGFIPDSQYASEDINAAVEKILEVSGQEKIDVLGWSWGTVTVGLFAVAHPEYINKLVLYAPILSGIGEYTVNEPFNHNNWVGAAGDFQRLEDGSIDYDITDPVIVDTFCSGAWYYDKESSPNGGRKDVCVSKTVKLIDLEKVTVPTLLICGDKDPYLNYDLVNTAIDLLPKGSVFEMIEGGSHVVYIEKPYYKDFQERLLKFLG